jgi:NAD(P)-dependent dehydrogenase (short-subunit alcohol dehydrogenase family)
MTSQSDRCAIVTGAAQGLGRATLERLLRDGMKVVGADKQGVKLAAVQAEIGAGARFAAVEADAATAVGAQRIVDTALTAHGRVDVLVNVAGGSGAVAAHDIEEIADDVWTNVLAANIGSTFLCTRAAVPHMRRRGYGRIVNFSSGLARGAPGKLRTVGCRLAYCAAKGAIESFTRQLAKDLDDTGITVNALVPGFVLTESGATVRERFERLSEAERRLVTGGRGVDQLARPVDIANAVAFLVSEAAGHISGVALDVG